jgi:hypothetical protein
VRTVVDEPGLRASLAADVNLVVSTGSTASGAQSVHVRQDGSTRARPEDSTDDEEQS